MNNQQIYFGDWNSFADLVEDFEGTYKESDLQEKLGSDRWKGMEVLFAAYTYEHYEGDAFVLFKRDGKLFEVNGGHCSCYGLSESNYCGDTSTQWEPEETTKTAILHRLDKGSGYGIFGNFKDQLRAAVEAA